MQLYFGRLRPRLSNPPCRPLTVTHLDSDPYPKCHSDRHCARAFHLQRRRIVCETRVVLRREPASVPRVSCSRSMTALRPSFSSPHHFHFRWSSDRRRVVLTFPG